MNEVTKDVEVVPRALEGDELSALINAKLREMKDVIEKQEWTEIGNRLTECWDQENKRVPVPAVTYVTYQITSYAPPGWVCEGSVAISKDTQLPFAIRNVAVGGSAELSFVVLHPMFQVVAECGCPACTSGGKIHACSIAWLIENYSPARSNVGGGDLVLSTGAVINK